MHVFATSLRDAADGFLHAGYISAQPASMALEYPALQDTADTGFAVTLETAFELGGAAAADGAIAAGPLASAGDPLAWAGASLPAAAAVIGALAIGALGWRQLRGDRWPRPGPWSGRWRTAASATAALALALSIACVGNPWDDTPPETFADPETATTVMLYSLVKEGVTAYHHAAGVPANLAVVDDEIALPVEEPGEGTSYALASYGRDGWAQAFDLAHEGDARYRVTSDGPDGEPDSGDELSLELDAQDLYGVARTYYLSRHGDTLWVHVRATGGGQSWDGANGGDLHGDEAGYAFDDRFYGIPLTVAYLETAWLSEGFDESPDWAPVIASIEAFYEGFITDDQPAPTVVQIYDPAVIG